MRRWVAFALFLSLALHAGLFYYLHKAQVDGFIFSEANLAPPKAFNLKRVSIPAPQPEERIELKDNAPNVARIEIPSDKPQVDEIQMAPQITETAKEIFAEKPRVDMAAIDKLTKANASARDKDLDAIAQGLIDRSPRMPRQPSVRVGGGRPAAGEGDSNISIAGLATVDEMIAKTGPLHAGDKAGMPGGALFEYNEYALMPDAVEALKKLGILIQRNPRATFSIEGHSDSFGPPEYNIRLSQLRAEAVKLWLVTYMQIAPERIQTRGFGNTKPIVPPDRSKEEQAPNRRVEIVVKTNRAKG